MHDTAASDFYKRKTICCGFSCLVASPSTDPHESPYSPIVTNKDVLESQDKGLEKLVRGYVTKG